MYNYFNNNNYNLAFDTVCRILHIFTLNIYVFTLNIGMGSKLHSLHLQNYNSLSYEKNVKFYNLIILLTLLVQSKFRDF